MADQELLVVVRMRDEASAVLQQAMAAFRDLGASANDAAQKVSSLNTALKTVSATVTAFGNISRSVGAGFAALTAGTTNVKAFGAALQLTATSASTFNQTSQKVSSGFAAVGSALNGGVQGAAMFGTALQSTTTSASSFNQVTLSAAAGLATLNSSLVTSRDATKAWELAWAAVKGVATYAFQEIIAKTDEYKKIQEQLDTALKSSSGLDWVRKSLEELSKAIDNPAFLNFVATLGAALFGATALAVDGVTLLVQGLTFLLENMDGVLSVLAVVAPTLLAAFGPAIMASIASGFATIGTAAVAALKAIGVALMANPIVLLATALVGAVTAVYYFRDEIEKAIGIDVVDVTKIAGNLLINVFRAAWEEIKFLWNNFGNMIGAAVYGGVNIAIKAINDLLFAAADGINWLIRAANNTGLVNWKEVARGNGIAELNNQYAKILKENDDARAARKAEIWASDPIGDVGALLGKRSTPGEKPSIEPTIIPAGTGSLAGTTTQTNTILNNLFPHLEKYNELKRGETKVLGQNAEATTRVWKGREQLNDSENEAIAYQAGLTKAVGDFAKGMTEAQTKVEGFLGSIRKETSTSQENARAQIFMTPENATRAKYREEYIAKAKNQNVVLDATGLDRLDKEVDERIAAEAHTARIKETVSGAKEAIKSFLHDVRTGLKEGATFWEAFGKAARTALDKIIEKLTNTIFDKMVNGVVDWMFDGGSKGPGASTGSMLSQAITWMAKLLPFADGGIMTSRGPVPLRKYSGGGIATSPQLAMFGEGSVPEAYVPVPSGRIPVELRGGGGRGAMTVQTNISVNMAAPADGQASGGRGGNMMEQARELGAIVTAMVNKNLQDQMRPGGLLNPSGSFSAGVMQ
ncbi:hypothetical protein [Reyranella sp.]|uniref:hypothetical protein n=1 Tax=Reyranella sp. TaxID=1929291 RepID=UPI001206E200|nr:hypothetical protein [Reyranella sp.]TAJ84570.1 MAG: hypothetical protein EPO50_17935 [Reyranella sp.]